MVCSARRDAGAEVPDYKRCPGSVCSGWVAVTCNPNAESLAAWAVRTTRVSELTRRSCRRCRGDSGCSALFGRAGDHQGASARWLSCPEAHKSRRTWAGLKESPRICPRAGDPARHGDPARRSGHTVAPQVHKIVVSPKYVPTTLRIYESLEMEYGTLG